MQSHLPGFWYMLESMLNVAPGAFSAEDCVQWIKSNDSANEIFWYDFPAAVLLCCEKLTMYLLWVLL